MIKSMKLFSQTKNVVYNLNQYKLKYLLNASCCFCGKHTEPSKKSYQNVGLHKWKKGFVDKNVFPLCKVCYIIRNGQTKTELLNQIDCILFRKPSIQKMKYSNQDTCKKYDNAKLCKDKRCTYCHINANLTIDKIDPC